MSYYGDQPSYLQRSTGPVLDPTHRTYQKLPVNHPLTKELRAAPIDIRQFYFQHRANPDILGEENWWPIPHGGGIEYIRSLLAGSLQTNEARRDMEIFGRGTKARQFYIATAGAENPPFTPTFGSGWYKEAKEAEERRHGNSSPLINNQRRDGQHR